MLIKFPVVCSDFHSPATRKTKCIRDLFAISYQQLGHLVQAPSSNIPLYKVVKICHTISIIESSMIIKEAYPWLRGVEINTLYPLGAGKELPLLNANPVSNLANLAITRSQQCPPSRPIQTQPLEGSLRTLMSSRMVCGG